MNQTGSSEKEARFFCEVEYIYQAVFRFNNKILCGKPDTKPFFQNITGDALVLKFLRNT